MSESESKTAQLGRSSRLLSLSTMISRFLGFFREMLTADLIGGGLLMSSWVQASTIANVFRRLLSEGALAQALVPLLVHSYEKDGQERGVRRFCTVFVWLTLILGLLTLAIVIPSLLLAPLLRNEQWRIVCLILPLVMPYAIFVGIVGLLTALCNSLRDYFLPSTTAILQNVVFLAVLLFFCPREHGIRQLETLAYGLLSAGGLEVLLMLLIIRHRKLHLSFDRSVWSDIGTIWSLFGRAIFGVMGAAALQISMLFDRAIASWVGDYAPAALYNSDRLIYLPIGIFAVAFGTVSLTEMSHASAEKDDAGLMQMLVYSMRSLLFLTIPIAVFMAIFGEELVRTCFFRGAFDITAVRATADALTVYAYGIPAFAMLKISLSGFYAQGDMRTPFYVSIGCIILNIVLNCISVFFLGMGQTGIALATVLSSYLNNLLLLLLLDHRLSCSFPLRQVFLFCLGILCISLFCGGIAWSADLVCDHYVPILNSEVAAQTISEKLRFFSIQAGALVPPFFLFLLGFLLLTALWRFPEAETLRKRFLKKR